MKRSVLTLLALCAFATTTAHSAPELVGLAETFRAGTIVVRKHERLLYYVTGVGQAVRYPIGVGRIATQWTGGDLHNSEVHRPVVDTTAKHAPR